MEPAIAPSKTAARPRKRQTVIDETPGCAFGLITRKGLDDLAKDFERLEMKIDGILVGVVVTILLQVWRTLG